MAYMVKGLVNDELEQLHDTGRRPNIVFDGVTLERCVRKWMENCGEITSLVAAYSGSGGKGIAERASKRASNPEAGPSDRGRFVNTTSLLEGHANASARLLAAIPQNTKTQIYSTDIERGADPPLISEVNAPKSDLKVYDLRLMSEFLNKKNLNPESQSPIELGVSSSGLSSRPEKKAESLLKAAMGSEYQKPHIISLYEKSEDEIPYARIDPKGGSPSMVILDKEKFKEIALDEKSINGQILRAVTRQVATGSLDASEELIANHEKGAHQADIETFKEVYNEVTNKVFRPIDDEVARKVKLVASTISQKALLPKSDAVESKIQLGRGNNDKTKNTGFTPSSS